VDVNCSLVECSLEQGDFKRPALRLGLNRVKGLSVDAARQLVATRSQQPFISTTDLAQRTGLNAHELGALAAADALHGITGNRHRARWQVAGVEKPMPLLDIPVFNEAEPLLSTPSAMASVVNDYASTGLSLREHPMALVRTRLADHCLRAQQLWELPDGAEVTTAGLVITRQRPGSANNVTFVTLEDETGFINLVVWKQLAERQRQVLLNSYLLEVRGYLQRQDGVLHVIARHLRDRGPLLEGLAVSSHDFH